MNCWEFHKCGRQKGGARAEELGVCPAYPDYGHLCAHLVGTLCGGQVQGSLARKHRDCQECDFFKSEHYDHTNPTRYYFKESVQARRCLIRLAEEMSASAAEQSSHAEKVEATLAELKQAQAQLLQSEKMAAVGQLAAGIAHEINNPLGYISSNLNALREYLADLERVLESYSALQEALSRGVVAPELLAKTRTLTQEVDLPCVLHDCRDTLRESQEGVARIKEIVVALKDFSRLDQAEISAADLNEGVETTLKIVWNELKYKCTVVKNLSPLPPLTCYPRQLNQVFVNLLMNAAQSIEGSGQITIGSRAYQEPEPGVEVQIADTGKGISPENLGRIFEPFFTTKPVGKGTGLGLHIAYGIVTKHGGTIHVASEVHKGTVFTVRLPLNGVKRKETEGSNQQA